MACKDAGKKKPTEEPDQKHQVFLGGEKVLGRNLGYGLSMAMVWAALFL